MPLPDQPELVDVVPGYIYPQTFSLLSEAIINAAANGDNLVVAATGGQTIRVYKMFLFIAAATTITVKDGAGGAALTGAMAFPANYSWTLDFDGAPWFTTSAGNAFNINTNGANQMSGRLFYKKD